MSSESENESDDAVDERMEEQNAARFGGIEIFDEAEAQPLRAPKIPWLTRAQKLKSSLMCPSHLTFFPI